jgi:hypothetical protein
MKSRIGLLAAIALSAMTFTTTARAGDRMIDALASIPEEAIGFVCIPSLEQLDADYKQAIVDLGVQELVPPMAQSLLMTMKMVPMFATVDTTKPVMIVAMPAKTLAELGKSVALILPTTDPKPILQGMMGQENDDGTWKVNAFGTPMIAATGKGKLILASTAKIARKIEGNKKSYASRLTKEQRGFLEKLDIAVWIDAPPLIEMFRPQIDGLVMMAMMSNMGQGAMNEDGARAQKEQIDMLLDGTAGLGFGLALDRVGLDLRFGMTAKTGSELSKQMAGVATTGSLLTGLPSEDFLIVMGGVTDPKQTREATKEFDQAFAMILADLKLDEEKGKTFDELKDALKEWTVLLTGMRTSIHLLPENADGVIGAAAVIETTDSKKWMDLLDRMVDLSVELIDTPDMDEEFREFAGALSFTKDAETIGGTKFTHWKIDLSKIEDAEEDELAKMEKIIGKDGLLVRIGVVDSKTIVFAFGGGKTQVKTLVETVRSGRDIVGESAGVKKVNAELPSSKTFAMYFAADRILTLIKRVTKVLGEDDEIPFDVPKVDAPIAFVGSSAIGWTRADIYIPMELGAAFATVAKEMKAKEEAEAREAAKTEEAADPAEDGK